MTVHAQLPSAAVLDPLVRALEADKTEQSLESAFAQLARGGNTPLLLAMLKALVRHDLAGIAVRLLQSASGAVARDAALQQLQAQLAALPSGQVSEPILRRLWDANVEALRLREGRALTVVPPLEAVLPKYCAYRSAGGNTQMLRVGTGRSLDLVTPFRDHVQQARNMALPNVSQTTAYLLLGVPSEPVLSKLIASRHASGYLPPIDIVEPDAEIFSFWLSTISDPTLLEPSRVRTFTGEKALGELRTLLASDPHRAPGADIIATPRLGWTPPVVDRALFEEVRAEQAARRESIIRQTATRYASRRADYWLRRFASAPKSGPPLKVLGLTTRYSTVLQHSMRDIAAAFRRQGVEFDLVKQPHDSAALVDLRGALGAKDYDLVFVIDHLRFEFDGAIPANLPFVGWIQDHMQQLLDPKAGRSIGAFDLVIGHSPGVMSALYGYPLDRFLATSNLTDPHEYDDALMPERALQPFRCDVSYVSHGSEPPEMLIQQMSGGSAPLRAYFTRFLEDAQAKLEQRGWLTNHELVELMLQAEKDSGHPALSPHVRRSAVYPSIAAIYDRLFRHQAVQWTADWARERRRSFCLYGRGWERQPQFAEFARGEVGSGQDLRALYQASSVSLQVNGYASLHQRLLDGLAAGAFMLVRHNPADFVRQPFAAIQREIQDGRLASMADLERLRESDADFSQICDQAERFSSAVLRSSTDARRSRHIDVINEGNPVSDLVTDEGLFSALAVMRYFPTRVAGDIPEFERVTFCSREELFQLLDRYGDDPQARQATVRPMREDIVKHDTYDRLVQRIINAFQMMWTPSREIALASV